MSGKSVRGGRTRFLQEGDVFGAISFFTGAEQMEVGGAGGPRLRGSSQSWCERHRLLRLLVLCQLRHRTPLARGAHASSVRHHFLCQTVLSLGVVRVLAVHRSEYESIADRFKVRGLQRQPPLAEAGCRVTARAGGGGRQTRDQNGRASAWGQAAAVDGRHSSRHGGWAGGLAVRLTLTHPLSCPASGLGAGGAGKPGEARR